jgi:surfactin synthase thioesterase subunit
LSDWVRIYSRSDSAECRLVCFPHAGGSASYFTGVARAMSPAVEVLAMQYPGRQDRRNEKLIDDVGALADLIRVELTPWLDRPFAFFGHSLGATVAFEVALRLAKDGVVPVAFFASGRTAPSRTRMDTVHQRDDDGIMAEVRSLAGTESVLMDDPEIRELVLPVLRNDYRAAETYKCQPGSTLPCPVLTLIGTEDDKVNEAEARAWAEHTTGGFELITFPGGHFYLNEQAPAVIKLLSSRLSSGRE